MDLYIAESGKGRGVYAAKPYREGELIELCPVIVVPEVEIIQHTALHGYYFSWGDVAAIALGYGSIYNHDDDPNAKYLKRLEERIIAFSAIKDIVQGREITIDYNSHHRGRGLWFDAM